MFYVYIAYDKDKNYHLGTTVDMRRRVKMLCYKFNKKCKIVYYEEYEDSLEADIRETELQKMPKELIQELVYENNPMLVDLI